MDKAPQVSLHSTAHFFLEGLNEIGIDYLFCNLGTDHAPLIEEMERWRNEGRKLPVTMLCPHENTAMHMAAGYAMLTGHGQAVLVHVEEFQALLAPGVEFAKVCEAAGGYGETLTDPEAVPEAIRRCLAEVRGGRPAVLHVKLPVL